MAGADPTLPKPRGRLRTAARLLARDRPLLGDYLRAYLAGRSRSAHRDPPAAAPSGAPPIDCLAPADAQPWVLAHAAAPAVQNGPALAEVRAARHAGADHADPAVARMAAGLAGDASLGELAYLIVRATGAQTVLETGVATGVTSAHVLAALADNGSGRLISVDLPPLALHAAGLVGHLVPAGLRGGWSYHWGSSRRLLPSLLELNNGRLDVFIHDSDHSYDSMRWELEQAWPALRPGGWMIADDVHQHSAFADVVAGLGAPAIYVEQPDKRGRTGVAVKPDA